MANKNKGRDELVLQLRDASATYATIGKQLGISTNTARESYLRACRRKAKAERVAKGGFHALSVRTLNGLANLGLDTRCTPPEQVAKFKRSHFLGVGNFGAKSLKELEEALAFYGLTLAGD